MRGRMSAAFPSYTRCSKPEDYSRPPYRAITLLMLAVVALGIAAVAVFGLRALAIAVAATLAAACVAAILFTTWWLRIRLIGLGDERGAVSVVFSLEPPAFDPVKLTDYDTDYSFNLLLAPFRPTDVLPRSFTDEQWEPGAEQRLAAAWPALPNVPRVPWATVKPQTELVIAQQSMATLKLGFVGQQANPPPPSSPPGAPPQSFLLHCELEGPGIYNTAHSLSARSRQCSSSPASSARSGPWSPLSS